MKPAASDGPSGADPVASPPDPGTRGEPPGPRGSARAASGPKPSWLKKPLPEAASLRKMEALLRERGLHTVCESASCPNLGECFRKGTATFLILGDVCTRDCGFCGVTNAIPSRVDPEEPAKVAETAARLGLGHVVITSVTRDDLADGGSGHYAATIRAVREALPAATVEVLVPDFGGDAADVALVLAERPDVFNHNVETVPRLYRQVRPQADYVRSLAVLRQAASQQCDCIVKTGLMVGLGEEPEEVNAVLRDVQGVGVRVVTIGQYLRPSPHHLPVVEYVEPRMFASYREEGEALGLQVHAGPFVRSSFQAGESLAQARRLGGQ